ncbi:unnamed protein product [Psylliodes chrysocephalus]|uniref:FHA domain-containing protein n=1 Tax=Psylliodes chrysocephalus TaxID=3402493 RepID=A0A9P0DAS6_9CUCU|nr:unnamed protein product [Psylliodes chrysocephala]
MENSSSSCSSESDSEGCGYLVFFMKKGEQSYTLVEGETTIGSSVDADIRLMPQTAPIHYCSIDVNEYGIATLFNKCTASLIKVNEAPLKDHTILRSGDFIQLQGKKFQYLNDFITNKDIDEFIKGRLAPSHRKSTTILKSARQSISSAKKTPMSSKKSPTLKTKTPSQLPLRRQTRKSESIIHSKLPNSDKKSKRYSAISFNTRKSPQSTRKSPQSTGKSPQSTGKLNISTRRSVNENLRRLSLSNARKISHEYQKIQSTYAEKT